MLKNCRYALVGLLAMMFATLALAQIKETGNVHGYVVDEAGASLPGVSVKISGPNLIGGAKTYVTDLKGYYRFTNLPTGPYTVSAELPGFTKFLREVMSLHADTTLAVDFVMTPATVKEEVVVRANPPTIDVKSSAVGATVVTSELLQSLPTQRTLGDLFGMGVGTEVSSIQSLSAVTVDAYGIGGTGESNGYAMDGVSLKSSALGTLRNSPDFNSIQEASIQGLGLPAEYGQYTGAVLSAITKSGSNRLQGLIDVRYNGRQWNSQNLSAIPAESFFDPADRDKTFQSGSLLDLSAQVGGKFIKDKLWFFLAGSYGNSREYPLGTTGTKELKRPRVFGKLTFQASPANTLSASASYENMTGTNVYLSPQFPEGVSPNRTEPGLVGNLNWTSVLSPNSLLAVKFGYNNKKFSVTCPNGDAPAYFDYGTNAYSGNWLQWQEIPEENVFLNAHLSHFASDLFLGSHDLKFGAEVELRSPKTIFGFPGNNLYYTLFGEPYMRYYMPPVDTNNKYRTFTAFLQDSWLLTKRLNLNLGVRYDNYYFQSTGGRDTLYKSGNISPRAGLSYDLLGDRKNVIKFHFGHYYEGLYSETFRGSDAAGNPEAILYMWDGTDYVEAARYNSAPILIDPKFKQPYLREFVAGYERELFRDASLSVHFYYRKVIRFLGMYNLSAQWATMPVINPGPDGIEGTADDMGTLNVYYQLNPGEDTIMYANPKRGDIASMTDEPRKTMKGIEVVFAKRFSNRWQMIASYNYSRIRGNASGMWTEIGMSPNYFINAYGMTSAYYGQPHQFKVQAAVLLPLDINLGVVGAYLSGRPKTDTFVAYLPTGATNINAVAPGTNKFDATKQLDIQIEKQFKMGTARVSFLVDFYNIFNSHSVTDVSTVYGPSYDKIYTVQPPRRFQAGFRVMY